MGPVHNGILSINVTKNKIVDVLDVVDEDIQQIFVLVNDTMDAVLVLQQYIQNNGGTIIMEAVGGAVNDLLSMLDTFISQMMNGARTFFQCKPIIDVYHAVVQGTFCEFLINPLTGFWFCLGQIAFCFTFSVIVAVRLAKYYHRMKYETDVEQFIPQKRHKPSIPPISFIDEVNGGTSKPNQSDQKGSKDEEKSSTAEHLETGKKHKGPNARGKSLNAGHLDTEIMPKDGSKYEEILSNAGNQDTQKFHKQSKKEDTSPSPGLQKTKSMDKGSKAQKKFPNTGHQEAENIYKGLKGPEKLSGAGYGTTEEVHVGSKTQGKSSNDEQTVSEKVHKGSKTEIKPSNPGCQESGKLHRRTVHDRLSHESKANVKVSTDSEPKDKRKLTKTPDKRTREETAKRIMQMAKSAMKKTKQESTKKMPEEDLCGSISFDRRKSQSKVVKIIKSADASKENIKNPQQHMVKDTMSAIPNQVKPQQIKKREPENLGHTTPELSSEKTSSERNSDTPHMTSEDENWDKKQTTTPSKEQTDGTDQKPGTPKIRENNNNEQTSLRTPNDEKQLQSMNANLMEGQLKDSSKTIQPSTVDGSMHQSFHLEEERQKHRKTMQANKTEHIHRSTKQKGDIKSHITPHNEILERAHMTDNRRQSQHDENAMTESNLFSNEKGMVNPYQKQITVSPQSLYLDETQVKDLGQRKSFKLKLKGRIIPLNLVLQKQNILHPNVQQANEIKPINRTVKSQDCEETKEKHPIKRHTMEGKQTDLTPQNDKLEETNIHANLEGSQGVDSKVDSTDSTEREIIDAVTFHVIQSVHHSDNIGSEAIQGNGRTPQNVPADETQREGNDKQTNKIELTDESTLQTQNLEKTQLQNSTNERELVDAVTLHAIQSLKHNDNVAFETGQTARTVLQNLNINETKTLDSSKRQSKELKMGKRSMPLSLILKQTQWKDTAGNKTDERKPIVRSLEDQKLKDTETKDMCRSHFNETQKSCHNGQADKNRPANETRTDVEGFRLADSMSERELIDAVTSHAIKSVTPAAKVAFERELTNDKPSHNLHLNDMYVFKNEAKFNSTDGINSRIPERINLDETSVEYLTDDREVIDTVTSHAIQSLTPEDDIVFETKHISKISQNVYLNETELIDQSRRQRYKLKLKNKTIPLNLISKKTQILDYNVKQKNVKNPVDIHSETIQVNATQMNESSKMGSHKTKQTTGTSPAPNLIDKQMIYQNDTKERGGMLQGRDLEHSQVEGSSDERELNDALTPHAIQALRPAFREVAFDSKYNHLSNEETDVQKSHVSRQVTEKMKRRTSDRRESEVRTSGKHTEQVDLKNRRTSKNLTLEGQTNKREKDKGMDQSKKIGEPILKDSFDMHGETSLASMSVTPANINTVVTKADRRMSHIPRFEEIQVVDPSERRTLKALDGSLPLDLILEKRQILGLSKKQANEIKPINRAQENPNLAQSKTKDSNKGKLNLTTETNDNLQVTQTIDENKRQSGIKKEQKYGMPLSETFEEPHREYSVGKMFGSDQKSLTNQSFRSAERNAFERRQTEDTPKEDTQIKDQAEIQTRKRKLSTQNTNLQDITNERDGVPSPAIHFDRAEVNMAFQKLFQKPQK